MQKVRLIQTRSGQVPVETASVVLTRTTKKLSTIDVTRLGGHIQEDGSPPVALECHNGKATERLSELYAPSTHPNGMPSKSRCRPLSASVTGVLVDHARDQRDRRRTDGQRDPGMRSG